MPRTIMRSLTIQEIAGVTKPAMGGALAVFMKRAPVEDFGKCAALTTAAGEGDETHTHLVRMDSYDGPLSSGMTSYADEHAHPWVMGENGPVIGEVEGHTHTIATVGKSADGTPSEEPMADQKNDEILKAENATLLAKVAALTALAAMTDAERSYMKGLPAAEAEKFPTLPAETRASMLKAAADANPVVFKSADGTEFRKSDPPAMIAMAKKLDEQAAQLAKSEALAKQALYEKRATDEIPHLPGDLAVRAEMLKAIDSIPDAETRKKALETLKAQNSEMAKAFETRGTSRGNSTDSPDSKLEALAKKIATEKSVPYAKAYDLALSSPEGAALYAAYAKSRE